MTVFATVGYCQNSTLEVGNKVGDLRVGKWIKGYPFKQFKKGKVYVLEFWSTWCLPCKAAMPHISSLAQKYSDRVVITGINIREKKNTSIETISRFVENMGSKILYNIVLEDERYTQSDWIIASGSQSYGIPITFIINTDGRLAWIGNPSKLSDVLYKILNNQWDLDKEIATRTEFKNLKKSETQLRNKILSYIDDFPINMDIHKADSILSIIDKDVRILPKLEYTPTTVFYKFLSLLITNSEEAYRYGQKVLCTILFDEPEYDQLIYVIEMYTGKLDIPIKIYRLGAEAYNIKINNYAYPEIMNIPRRYTQMAEMYWLAKDAKSAQISQLTAIKELKKREDFSMSELIEYEKKLKEYNINFNP